MNEEITKEIELPEKTTAQIGATIKIIGPQGEAEKILVHPKIKINQKNNKIIINCKKSTKNEKKIIHSFAAHIKNMVQGVNEKHVYKLKICSGHFPMTVTVAGKELIIKNFLGENTPRKLDLNPEAEVKVDGNEIIITSTSKEVAGQVAGSIEQLTKVKKRDNRIFQDGCYVIHKSGKEIN